MSLDISFNNSLSKEEIEEKTSLIVESKRDRLFLSDTHGNSTAFNGYGISIYSLNNPTKILDELVGKLGVKFIDDEACEKLHHEPENYDVDVLSVEVMAEYGYTFDSDGNAQVPIRDESSYLPFGHMSQDGSLPF